MVCFLWLEGCCCCCCCFAGVDDSLEGVDEVTAPLSEDDALGQEVPSPLAFPPLAGKASPTVTEAVAAKGSGGVDLLSRGVCPPGGGAK